MHQKLSTTSLVYPKVVDIVVVDYPINRFQIGHGKQDC